ncbi:flavin reductase [Neorhizobium sp. JUb45]|uniref:flavin reductase n=1 Tax=Neorhizobium sp. JUb45 TaxID=2485113 RepID=UPI00104C9067|nr:flavin reductase [Neorhizobium sp. JUb45]TCR02985.1 flavin reductase [Neorhizobium sp. JUb45]
MQGQAVSKEPDNTEETRREDYRNAMAKLGAAVHIVTTSGAAGRAGFAATAVCSVSDNPPTLLVCLNKTSSAYWPVKGNGTICVNVLSSDHQDLSRLFGGKTPVEERFAGASWTELPSGGLALDGALASFDCEITSVADGHSHDILICRVLETQVSDGGQSLIYLNRGYHAV